MTELGEYFIMLTYLKDFLPTAAAGVDSSLVALVAVLIMLVAFLVVFRLRTLWE